MNHASASVTVVFVGYEVECSECGFIDSAHRRAEATKIQRAHSDWHQQNAQREHGIVTRAT